MKIFNKYKLELHWDSVKYEEGGEAFLIGAYFSGPVLKEAAKLRNNDQLTLDLTPQHLILIPDYYHATLKWGAAEHKEDRVLLNSCSVKGKYVNSLEKLRDKDWLLISCENHDEKRHPFHLVYFAEIMNSDRTEKY